MNLQVTPSDRAALAAIRAALKESGVDTDFMSDAELRETIYRAHRSANYGKASPVVFVTNVLSLVERKRSTYE